MGTLDTRVIFLTHGPLELSHLTQLEQLQAGAEGGVGVGGKAGEMMAWRHVQSDVSGAVHNIRRGATQL